ncbi:MAG: hypothetical protein OEY26_11585 [Nitrospinota bacterium]|nr:hypothetical protein [Nitrospinota bacterium]
MWPFKITMITFLQMAAKILSTAHRYRTQHFTLFPTHRVPALILLTEQAENLPYIMLRSTCNQFG